MPAAGRFIAKMASHWTWKLCQWPWNVKSTLRKARSSTTETWITLKKTRRYVQLRSFTFLYYMISTRNYLRPCMYKRHKPGMYKRLKPGMYKRQFAPAQPSLPIIWTSSTECPALPVALSAAKAVWSEEFNGNLKASTCGIFAKTPGWQVETNRYIIYV